MPRYPQHKRVQAFRALCSYVFGSTRRRSSTEKEIGNNIAGVEKKSPTQPYADNGAG